MSDKVPEKVENKVPAKPQTEVLVLDNYNAVKKFAAIKGKQIFLSQMKDLSPEKAEAIFNKELSFAMQLISGKNQDYMIKTIGQNPTSFLFAIANCAASGLSLSPELKLGYLVPRDGKVMFQSSYMGKKEVVMASGLVKNVYAELVYANDQFSVEKGTNPRIDHKPDVFSDNRGKIIGAYAVAFLSTGANHIEAMSMDEVNKIKARSATAGKSFSPWTSDENEMIKKTLLNRIFKSLPKLASSKALMTLIENDAKMENDIDQYSEPVVQDVDFTEE